MASSGETVTVSAGGGGGDGVHAMAGEVAARRTAAEAARRREETMGWGETEFELVVALTAVGRSYRRQEEETRAKGLRMEAAPARKAMAAARVCGAEITKV